MRCFTESKECDTITHIKTAEMFMRTNYHTHTFRCRHALGTDEEYVLHAIENGYTELGFSDHTAWPRWPGDCKRASDHPRMGMEELDAYFASICELKEKYSDRIRIRLGLECEAFPMYYDWLRETAKRVDYLLLGNHWGGSDACEEFYFGYSTKPEQLTEYLTSTLEGMRSGMFTYLAHPDLPFADYPAMDETLVDMAHTLCAEAEKLHMPLEYNLYGVEKQEKGRCDGFGYPAKEFWQIASGYHIEAIVGVDAHKPEHLDRIDRIDTAKEYLRSLGIRVLDALPDEYFTRNA